LLFHAHETREALLGNRDPKDFSLTFSKKDMEEAYSQALWEVRTNYIPSEVEVTWFKS